MLSSSFLCITPCNSRVHLCQGPNPQHRVFFSYPSRAHRHHHIITGMSRHLLAISPTCTRQSHADFAHLERALVGFARASGERRDSFSFGGTLCRLVPVIPHIGHFTEPSSETYSVGGRFPAGSLHFIKIFSSCHDSFSTTVSAQGDTVKVGH